MIRVTVELLPFGSESDKSTVAEYKIWNDGTHEDRPTKGNYQYMAKIYGDKLEMMLSGSVKNHRRSLGVNRLLRQVCMDAEKQLNGYRP